MLELQTYVPKTSKKNHVFNLNECFPRSSARINTFVDEITRKNKHFKKKIITRKLRQEHGKWKATWEDPISEKQNNRVGRQFGGKERATEA